MKIPRKRTIVVFSLAGLAGGLLFHTSQNVQRSEEKLSQLRTVIAHEQESLRLLNAEWAFLNNPDRLEKLARQYLDLTAPAPDMVVASDQLPPKAEEIPSAAVSSKAQESYKSPVQTTVSILAKPDRSFSGLMARIGTAP